MERYYSGRASVCLAQAVKDAKREIMRRDSSLTELAAHRLAIDAALRGNPEILKLYRQDVKPA